MSTILPKTQTLLFTVPPCLTLPCTQPGTQQPNSAVVPRTALLVRNGVDGVVRRAAAIHHDKVLVTTGVSALLKALGMDPLQDKAGACGLCSSPPPPPPPLPAGHGLLASDTETSGAVGATAFVTGGVVTNNSWQESTSKQTENAPEGDY